MKSLIIAWLLTVATIAQASDKRIASDIHKQIELLVFPGFCIAPCTIRTNTRIEPHKDNRYWAIVVDGTILRSSIYQLEGTDAALRHWLDYKDLPEGVYTVSVSLYRRGFDRAVAQDHATIEVH